jgi:hypothetical protein
MEIKKGTEGEREGKKIEIKKQRDGETKRWRKREVQKKERERKYR